LTTAVIFVPAEHVAVHVTQCLNYCSARGYDVAGVVRGNWKAAANMLATGVAGVIVAARLDHLNPDREPRTEVAATGDGGDTAALSAGTHRRRRPRPI
jgi:hypothetical protein